MSSYVFVGPTISEDKARNWLDAIYLPPVSQGDILSLLRKNPKIIGIIDGYFESVPAVWHKEILLALSKGVHVVGGASMGALRAAELHSYGMVGIGEIFQWYRDGMIEADDEVAVRHAPEEYKYKQVSEPLVNIRKTLSIAREQAVISTSAYERLIAISSQLFYPQRSYPVILDKGLAAGISEEEIASLKDYLENHTVDLKKRDAIKVLEYISELEKNDHSPKPIFDFQHTARFDDLMDKDISMAVIDGIQLTPEMLVTHARDNSSDFKNLKNRAAANMLILEFAKNLGVIITESELQDGLRDFRKYYRLNTDEEALNWAQRNDLTEEEFEQLIREWLLIKKMKIVLQANNRELIRQLRWEGKYEAMLMDAAAKEKANLSLE